MGKENLFQEVTQQAQLLKKQLSGTLSPAEKRQLAHWLKQSRQNRELWKRFREGRELKAYYTRRQQIDPQEEYKRLLHRYPELREKKFRRLPAWSWSAAVVALGLGIALWQWPGREKAIPAEVPLQEKVMAVLHTSRGETFRLSENKDGIPAAYLPDLQLRDSLQELICQGEVQSGPISWHTLEIPRGGEYKLVLSDGTKVWLNSETVIRFPGTFGKHSREISLRGEAYFEVTPDKQRPFRIQAGDGSVEVLGTSFMMSVYPEEQQWSATLLQGSVRAGFGKQSQLLTPGYQAYLKEGKLQSRKADTEKETAWVNGWFIFRHDRLEEVTQRLARWYNVSFQYENEKLKSYVFTGKVSRDIGIEKILELMEQMNVVGFEPENGYILIKEKAGKS